MDSSRPPAYWPTSESDNLIVVEDLVIKYAPELPPVLHNVSFTLKGRERVGLLGRTGGSMLHRFLCLLRSSSRERKIHFGYEHITICE
jgi:ABC-type glutathione transport system ATPase component